MPWIALKLEVAWGVSEPLYALSSRNMDIGELCVLSAPTAAAPHMEPGDIGTAARSAHKAIKLLQKESAERCPPQAVQLPPTSLNGA